MSPKIRKRRVAPDEREMLRTDTAYPYPAGEFDWRTWTAKDTNSYLQHCITDASVTVSLLHPIMRGRLVAGFQALERRYGPGKAKILSAVRTEAEQVYLRNKYGSPRAADPFYNRGIDFEGIAVKGSQHQEQGRDGEPKFGHAVDFRLFGVSWSQLWEVFEPIGIVFPLRNLSGAAMEEWHAVDRDQSGWHPGIFPVRCPGRHRTIRGNDVGADVATLQKRIGAVLEVRVAVDGKAGPSTMAGIVRLKDHIGIKGSGEFWNAKNEHRWQGYAAKRRAEAKGSGAKPVPVAAPVAPVQVAPAVVAAAIDKHAVGLLIQSAGADLDHAARIVADVPSVRQPIAEAMGQLSRAHRELAKVTL